MDRVISDSSAAMTREAYVPLSVCPELASRNDPSVTIQLLR
ncbi:hypothetical protein [Methanospirillum purgamenti]|nr:MULTISPECIES: hypothetical protein [Methanospirillum]MDX8550680.1 hypothetical protein [Methanospirillum hungatei]